jgi:phospholipid-binding lipoprotein MlaA
VFANAILQGKFDQAVMDSARVVANTTFGVLGFFDVASRLELPKHNEDFGQTLGVWGVGSGPYLVLPFLGPSSARDAPGIAVDWFAFSPVRWLNPTFRDRVIALVVEGIDTRADLLRVEKALEGAVLDRYLFIREAYLQRRLNLVHDGNPPTPEFEDLDFEDLEDFQDLEETDEGAVESSIEAAPSEALEPATMKSS